MERTCLTPRHVTVGAMKADHAATREITLDWQPVDVPTDC